MPDDFQLDDIPDGPSSGEQPVNLVRCPNGHTMRVIDTRKQMVGKIFSIYRRRECPKCGFRQSTAEVPLSVAKEVFGED